MTACETGAPARTALYEEHAKLGANFTNFGGWDMPLRYGSELAEHHAVRQSAGLFDLSHMGEIRVTGPDAGVFLNTALAGNMAVMAVGKAKYSLILAADGGIIDDLITYRLAEQEFLVVPNAGNAKTVAAELTERAAGFDVTVVDESLEYSLVAVQGPNSEQIVQQIVNAADRDKVAQLKYYAAVTVRTTVGEILLARTGYTGEDGFELYVVNENAVPLWQALLVAGADFDLMPAGLACRDSLRLEAGMPLYCKELDLHVNPFEVGLGPVVSFAKSENFVGRAALEPLREQTPQRVLVGLQGTGRRAGRNGYPVRDAAGNEIGVITSGQPSPTLGYPVAMAFVQPEFAAEGTELSIDLRGKLEPAVVVPLPFYKRQK